MAPPVSPTNAIFAKGYLFLTPTGGGDDDLPCGELQEVELNDSIDLAEAFGPSQLGAVAVGVKSRKITLTAKWLKLRARVWKAARGSTPVYGSATTIPLTLTEEPVVFKVHLKNPSGGTDIEVLLYGCVAPDLKVPMKMGDWVIPEVTINCYGNGTKFGDIILPGDQTTS